MRLSRGAVSGAVGETPPTPTPPPVSIKVPESSFAVPMKRHSLAISLLRV